MRRILIIALTLLIVGGAAIGLLSYRRSFQKVSISLDPGVSGKLFSAWDGDRGLHNPENHSIASFSSSFEGRFKKGTYTLETQNNQSYEDQAITIKLGPEPVNIKPHLDYTQDKLTQILSSEQQAITRALDSKYPKMISGYDLNNGRLFRRGEWFGAKLLPSDVTRDVLRIVMKKGSGQWQIISDLPQIVLTTINYPGVPVDILRAINTL